MKTIIGLASLLAAIALIVIPLGQPQRVVAAIDGPVRVESGLISGVTDAKSDIKVFKGIPYAAPPVADLRWKPPAPVKSWTGVRQADQTRRRVCSR